MIKKQNRSHLFSSILAAIGICTRNAYSYTNINPLTLTRHVHHRQSTHQKTSRKNSSRKDSYSNASSGKYGSGGYSYSYSCSTASTSLMVASSTTSPSAKTNVGNRIPIDEKFDGLTQIYSNPDIFVIEDFLDEASCQDLISKAQDKSLDLSPVAYAGKSNDKNELVSLAAKGPVAWLSILGAWYQLQSNDSGDSMLQLGLHALQNYAVLFVLAFISITAFIEFRADGLQSLRTSTSTTLDDLDDLNSGTATFVTQSANLFNPNTTEKANPAKHAQYFESPTIIRYEKDQVLTPHFDANRAASTEDLNRGGQTLATLLVYLNDVDNGGNTRFGKLFTDDGDDAAPLTVKPKMGDALLFFPADENGVFDDRLEHEGCLAVDTKWIARIWRHIDRVPPPFGLTNGALSKLKVQQ